MESWLGQYCINVTDLDRTVAFYEAIGLTNTSRTDIPQAREAIMEDAGGKGGKIQLAQQLANDGPIDMGNAFWKLYVNTNDIEKMYKAAIDFGCESLTAPQRLERWPTSVGFVKDPDGYHGRVRAAPPLARRRRDHAGVGRPVLHLRERHGGGRKFWETLGLTCTSETDIPNIKEAILEHPDKGGKIQLAQKLEDDSPIAMGTAMWKLYVWTDDCQGLYDAAVVAGYTSVVEPCCSSAGTPTMAFVADPDGYQVELVTRHPD